MPSIICPTCEMRTCADNDGACIRCQIRNQPEENAPNNWQNEVGFTDENPKDQIGSTKAPMGLPDIAVSAGSLAVHEGALKYGAHNWRHSPVRASVYVEAIKRHLAKWAAGEEADPETCVPHLGSIIGGCAILLDAQQHGTLTDDRHKTPTVAQYLDGNSPAILAKLTELYGKDTRLLKDRV